MQIRRMKSQYIYTLKAINPEYFAPAMHALTQVSDIDSGDGFADLHNKAAVVNIVTTALCGYFAKNKQAENQLFGLYEFCLLDYLFYGSSEIRKRTWEDLLALRPNAATMDRLYAEFNLSEEKLIEHMQLLSGATEKFLKAPPKATKPILFHIENPESNSWDIKSVYIGIKQRSAAEEEISEIFVGTTIALYMECHGVTDTIDWSGDIQELQELYKGMRESCAEQMVNPDDLKLFLVGGDVCNMHEYLPLFYDRAYEPVANKVIDFHLCLHSATFFHGESSSFPLSYALIREINVADDEIKQETSDSSAHSSSSSLFGGRMQSRKRHTPDGGHEKFQESPQNGQ